MDQAIVSAVIGGIFTLIGIVLNHRLERKWASKGIAATTGTATSSRIGQLPGAPPNQTIPPFSIGKSLIHIGVIQFSANVLGFILGIVIGVVDPSETMTPEIFYLIVIIAGSFIFIIGFAISGAKVNRLYRWQHLFYVALGVFISTLLVNQLLLNVMMDLQIPLDTSSLIIGATQTFVCMGIGGVIANTVNP